MQIRAVLALATIAVALAAIAVARSSTPGPAEDSGSCMQDALSICSQFIPDRERVAACLLSNRNHVSSGCRAALAHFVPRTASSR
jgi:hypothetical protein